MTVSIRAAGVADAAGIAAVHTQSWAETYRGLMPDAFLDRMTSGEMQVRREAGWAQTVTQGAEVVWVAVLDGQVVAFASAGEAGDHPGVAAELFTLYSLNRVQGRGVGRALLHAVLQEVRARGAGSAACWVLDVNPARAWYARQGAHEAGGKVQAIPGGELREVRMVWPDLGALPD
ncbi:GNAT family N-acetyltransferase [Deinococcus ficus]|uniref:GNAT family N-acetyltransferase n=1 Tax=Deinococcus ficus TaxID=317577 RepID=UPI0003B4CA1C|nr:GNAT family N-acetyltransferase [Deinococcus ficus]